VDEEVIPVIAPYWVRPEIPAALEDLAVVLAERGHETDARAALNEAVSLYDGLQARWDIRPGRQPAPALRHQARHRPAASDGP
jgi:hypothetical protein